MRHKQTSSQAFTLIESVITLGLVSLFLLLPFINFSARSTQMQENLFVDDLTASFTLIQNHAVLNGQTTRAEVIPGQNRIHFRVVGIDGHIIEHSVYPPESMRILTRPTTYTFQRHSGNYSSFQTLRFDSSQGWIELVFQMGSGRFYVRTS